MYLRLEESGQLSGSLLLAGEPPDTMPPASAGSQDPRTTSPSGLLPAPAFGEPCPEVRVGEAEGRICQKRPDPPTRFRSSQL